MIGVHSSAITEFCDGAELVQSCSDAQSDTRLSLCTAHPTRVTSHYSLHAIHPSLLTLHPTLLTPCYSPLTPCYSPLTTHSMLFTPHYSLHAIHPPLLTLHIQAASVLVPCLEPYPLPQQAQELVEPATADL